MKGRTDPSCPDYTRPSDAEERRAEYLTGNGRRASLKTPTYYTLKALDIGVAGKTIDLASMPLKTVDGECVLDLERVEAELLRTGKQAPSLSTIAVRWARGRGHGGVGSAATWFRPRGCRDLTPHTVLAPCPLQRRGGLHHVRPGGQRGGH